jgi:hypothetical protein
MAGSARPITRRRSDDEGRAALSDKTAGTTTSAVDGTISGMATHFSVLVLSFWLNVQRCNVQPSTFNLQPSTFNLQPSTFNLQPSTFNLQPSTFNLQRATRNLQPSTFNPYAVARRKDAARRAISSRRAW